MRQSLVAMSLFAATPAWGQPLTPELERGLVTLLTQQCEAVMGWSWDSSARDEPAPNVGGVIANTLLDAYERNPDNATWITLSQYAHRLNEVHTRSSRLPYKADIEFLARWGARAADPSATELGRDLFARLKRTSPTGAHEYHRIAAGRATIPAIIGYDVALGIRAALAVGDTQYASDLARAITDAGVLGIGNPKDAFAVAAAGAMLHALAELDGLDEARAHLTAELVRTQSATGSWAFNDTQATAYAVLGLAATGHEAADLGRRWLLSHQLEAGAWAAYHDGLPEPFVGPILPLVEAETLSALLAGI